MIFTPKPIKASPAVAPRQCAALHRAMLHRYKQLKKQLKRIHASRASSQAPPDAPQQQQQHPDGEAGQGQQQQHHHHQTQPPMQLSADEGTFVMMLNEDLTSFNTFFIEREEDAVIKLQALTDSVQAVGRAADAAQVQALKAALVDFHGESKAGGARLSVSVLQCVFWRSVFGEQCRSRPQKHIQKGGKRACC